MYTCNICRLEKDDEDFYTVKNSKLGHDKTCKSCRKIKVSQYRADNIEKVKEYDRNRPNQKARIKNNKERLKT